MVPSGRVTIAEVAVASGVGVGTVSRVINGSAHVREPTRRAVLDVIKRLGYRPSYLAASLSRGTPRSVAIVVPRLTTPSAVMRLAGALSVLDGLGYDTVVCNVDTPGQRDHHLTALTSRYRVDGVIVISLPLSRRWLASFRRAGLPLVAVDVTLAGVPHTVVDDAAGGRMATEHLLSLGHRRIGFVGDTGARAPAWVSRLRTSACAATRRRCGARASPPTRTWCGAARMERRTPRRWPPNCFRCPIRRRRSSRHRTRRRWVSSRRPTGPAGRFPASFL